MANETSSMTPEARAAGFIEGVKGKRPDQIPNALSFCCAIGQTPEESSQLLQASPAFLGRLWKPNPDLAVKDTFQATYAVTDKDFRVGFDSHYAISAMYKGTSLQEITKSISMGVEMDFAVSAPFFKAAGGATSSATADMEFKSKSMIFQLGGFIVVRTEEVDLARLNREEPENQKAWNHLLRGGQGVELFMHENGHHFVQKVFIGGRYNFRIELMWSSMEAKSTFDLSTNIKAQGQSMFVKLAVGLKTSLSMKSRSYSENLTVKTTINALGGDTRELTVLLISATAENLFDIIQQGLRVYFDSMTSQAGPEALYSGNGAVVWLDLCPISPGILQALYGIVEPTVATIFTERITKSFQCLRDCEKWTAFLQEKRDSYTKSVKDTPGGNNLASQYSKVCHDLFQKLDMSRELMRCNMMMRRGAVHKSGPKQGMPIEITDEEFGDNKGFSLSADGPPVTEHKKTKVEGGVLSALDKGLINKPMTMLQAEWDAVENLKKPWELLSGYGSEKFVRVNHTIFSEIEDDHLVYWTGPLHDGSPIALPDCLVVVPTTSGEGDPGGDDEDEMAGWIQRNWRFKIPGEMYRRGEQDIDVTKGVALARTQQHGSKRNQPFTWNSGEIPTVMMKFMKYFGRKEWDIPGMVTVVYEGIWEMGRMHGEGKLTFRWDCEDSDSFKDCSKRVSDGPLCVESAKGKFENNAPVGKFEVKYSGLDRQGKFDSWDGPILLKRMIQEKDMKELCGEDRREENTGSGKCPWHVYKDGQGLITMKDIKGGAGKPAEARFELDGRKQ